MKPGRIVLDFYLKIRIKKAQLRFWCSFVYKQVSEKYMFEFMPLCMVNITWLIDWIYTVVDIKRFLSYKSYIFKCLT